MRDIIAGLGPRLGQFHTFLVSGGRYWSGGATQPPPRVAKPQCSHVCPGMELVMVHSMDLSGSLATSTLIVPFLSFLCDASSWLYSSSTFRPGAAAPPLNRIPLLPSSSRSAALPLESEASEGFSLEKEAYLTAGAALSKGPRVTSMEAMHAGKAHSNSKVRIARIDVFPASRIPSNLSDDEDWNWSQKITHT